MSNPTQIERYQKLLEFLDKQFKSSISSKDIEEVSFYSYRNINRIFYALQQETIGHYLKRIKLEKAAEYLKYSFDEVSDIAIAVGYADLPTFSKAFKNHFGCSPTHYRNLEILKEEILEETIKDSQGYNKLEFTIEELPAFKILYLQYKGNYDNIKAIEQTWEKLVRYALKKKLFKDDTIIVGEVLDDDEISESLKCRYNAGIIIESNADITTEGLFGTKEIEAQKYAKFIHIGSHESCFETYNSIYMHWMKDVKLEFEDKPTLEFYLNDEETTPKEKLITEIYIPVK
ncbi:AraC family transcriptional regulator [Tenacibaculum sp. 190524A05c]|uniref:AraC family transcriptional regulator n=1 Tax=Tenacibaculum platacis TaxID=3137852 RepID=A0ABM9NV56_9FLAO